MDGLKLVSWFLSHESVRINTRTVSGNFLNERKLETCDGETAGLNYTTETLLYRH